MTTALTTLGTVTALMVVLWLVSLRLRDASLVDIFWGLGFVVIAWTSVALAEAPSTRGWMSAGLVTIWGVRLAAHLARRNLGHGEDFRYRRMREAWGPRFPLVSLGTVFLLQAVLMWIVSWPVQAVHIGGAGVPLNSLDGLGVVLWTAGLTIETMADAQLARFKRRPDSRRRVMDEGLWRYSRHPNYFGDFLVWWGLGCLSAAAGAWWALAGPVVMTVLLLRVSGVALLESTIAERRPAYRAYAARTSAFFPRPPKPGV